MKRQVLLCSSLLVATLCLYWRERVETPAANQAQPVKSTVSEAEGKAPAAIAEAEKKRPLAAISHTGSSAPGARTGRPWQDIAEWDKLLPKARLAKLLSAPFALQDSGQVRQYELALDELYLRQEDNPQARVAHIPLQSSADALLTEAEQMARKSGVMPQLVLYAKGTPKEKRSELNRWIVSNQVLLESANPSVAVKSALAAGVASAAPMEAAPGFVLALDERFPGASIVAAADLEKASGIKTSRPLLAYQKQRRFTPTDPLFSKQWHLKNTGSVHVNVSSVWDTNKGGSITMAVVDDGLQLSHPDLQANIDASTPTLHRDYNGSDNDPNPYAPTDVPSTADNEAEEGDSHGTAVGGLMAAVAGNAVGGVGVAPEAKLVGLRLIAAPSTAADEAAAFGHRGDVIAIKNNSWGPPDGIPWVLGVADPVVKAAFANAASSGRGGLGTILTFAAGNGRADDDQSNKDAYANDIHTLAIAALTSAGVPAVYSEYGANLVASAPSDGVTTTDLMGDAGYNPTQDYTAITQTDYTDEFNGTSAATPIVSGVVALMLQANPNLSWRDVKEILLRSGRKMAPTDTDWVSRTGGKPSLPVIKHNHKYGGGMVDAAAAVALATNWTALGTMTQISQTVSQDTTLPDNNATGITKSFDFTTDTPTRVESVSLTLNMHHQYRGDVEIRLISPTGVTSILAFKSLQDGGEEDPDLVNNLDPGDRGYFDWTFTSTRHWGESSRGVWKLLMRDLGSGDVGTFHDATLTLHGEAAPPVALATSPSGDFLALSGSNQTFSMTATGHPDITYKWLKGAVPLTTATTSTLTLQPISYTHASAYTAQASNVTGNASSTFKLGVVIPPTAAPIFNVGTTLTLSTLAYLPTGSTASYQWKKGGVDVVDDPVGTTARIKGATTRTLSILRCQNGDEGNYECQVTMGGAVLTTPVSAASIRYKPDIQLNAFPSDIIVSGAMTPLSLNIANGVTRILISGLPSGFTYNALTGVISGTPNVPVTNAPITITAYNLAGYTQKKIFLTVSPLPARHYGTFEGLIARHPSTTANNNLGGSITSLLVAASGSYSGKLQLGGSAALGFTGRLVSSLGNAATSTTTIRRLSPLTNLQLTFSINAATGALTGTLTDTTGTWTAAVSAIRRAATPALGSRQNFSLTPSIPVSSATAPAGYGAGYAVITTTTGAATMALRLADGTIVSRATSCSEAGEIPFYAPLYANKGSFRGMLNLTAATAPALDQVAGSFDWNKTGPSSATDKSYISGFDFGVGNANTVVAEGSEYVRPVSPVILWGLNNVAVGQSNAQLQFTGANIETSAYYLASASNINRSFRLSTAHLSTMPLPNTAAVTCVVNAVTGEISGTMTLKDGTPLVQRVVNYYGTVSMHHRRARGWFTLPQLPTTSVQAGSMEFTALP